MTTAFVVLLGLDVAVLLAGLTAVAARRRTITGRRGAFKGRLRIVEGEVDGLSSNWSTGYGHWVHDVLVWNTGRLMLRTELVPVDGTDASGIHAANGSVTGLGRRCFVVPLVSEDRSRLELATAHGDRDLALGPFAHSFAVGSFLRAPSALGESDYGDDT